MYKTAMESYIFVTEVEPITGLVEGNVVGMTCIVAGVVKSI